MPRLVEGSAVSALSVARDRQPNGASAGAKSSIAGGARRQCRRGGRRRRRRGGRGLRLARHVGRHFRRHRPLRRLPERTLHAFCHALPGRWHGMAVMLSAAASLSWIAGLLGRRTISAAWSTRPKPSPRSPDDVAAAPMFLPYLSGERTPHNDAAATGLFAGLRAEHGAEALAYRGDGGRRLLLRRRRRRDRRGRRAADLDDDRRRRRAQRFLGADDRRRDRPDIDLAESAEAGAALGAARLGMLAAGAGDEAAICARPADPTSALRRDRERAALSAPRLAALSRALSEPRRRRAAETEPDLPDRFNLLEGLGGLGCGFARPPVTAWISSPGPGL